LTQDVCRGVKCVMPHYKEFKEYKHFNLWNCGFIATANMNHTQHALDVNYTLSRPSDIAPFKEMQTLMYASLQERIKKGKLK
jgi:hypothetical protein